MKLFLTLLSLWALNIYAEPKRILVLWEQSNPPMNPAHIQEVWNRALADSMNWISLDSTRLLQNQWADSVALKPDFLKDWALGKLKVNGVLQLQFSPAESEVLRWKWFPLIGKIKHSQQLNIRYHNSKGLVSRTLKTQELNWGIWCGLHPCKAPNLPIDQIQKQQVQWMLQLVDSCAKALP